MTPPPIAIDFIAKPFRVIIIVFVLLLIGWIAQHRYPMALQRSGCLIVVFAIFLTASRIEIARVCEIFKEKIETAQAFSLYDVSVMEQYFNRDEFEKLKIEETRQSQIEEFNEGFIEFSKEKDKFSGNEIYLGMFGTFVWGFGSKHNEVMLIDNFAKNF